MRKKMIRYFTICMMFFLTTMQVKAADQSGTCGESLTWEIVGDMLLNTDESILLKEERSVKHHK